MKKKSWSGMLSLAVAGSMTVVAGCQPVSGVDVNKVISSSFAVKSSESKQTTTLEITPKAGAVVTPEMQQMLDFVGKMKLEVTEAKQQDALNASMKGYFEFSKGKIPFELVLTDGMKYTIWLEGMKQPIEIDNSPASAMARMQSQMGASQEDVLPQAVMDELENSVERAVELTPTLVGFFVNNFPNPKTVTAGPVTETVYGESLSLTKVHVEMQGSELTGLIKGFLTSMLADEKGTKEFIGALYDVYAPFMKVMLAEMKKERPEDTSMDMVTPYLENRTLAVEFAYTFVKSSLEKVVAEYDKHVETFTSSGEAAEIKSWLDDQTFKMDVFVDKDFLPRKTYSEFLLSLPEMKGEDPGIDLKITSTTEMWNVNKPVAINAIDTSRGVAQFDIYDMNASKFIASLDPQSTLYKLLKDDMKLTHKDIQMIVGQEDELYGTEPYNDNGTVMVPVRFVSEELDGDIKWLEETRQVRITDPLTGSVMLLTIGSNEATIDEQTVLLEKPATLVDSTTYVPVRVISEGMGAKVSWDQETQTVSIVRE